MNLVHAFRSCTLRTAPVPGVHNRKRDRKASTCLVKALRREDEGGSLIEQSLAELDSNPEQQLLLARLEEEGQAALTREERRARQRSLDRLRMPSFQKLLAESGATPLVRSQAKVLQLNIGLFCNQACSHCHVESSPLRKEMMDRATAERCMELLAASPQIETVDITGGAPELNSQFRYIVERARALGKEVIDRCNLTVLLEPGQEDLVDFLVRNKVRVVASMPCYSEANVDQQRGRGVFERSIAALQKLNSAGYGVLGTGLVLDLVYNPGGEPLSAAVCQTRESATAPQRSFSRRSRRSSRARGDLPSCLIFQALPLAPNEGRMGEAGTGAIGQSVRRWPLSGPRRWAVCDAAAPRSPGKAVVRRIGCEARLCRLVDRLVGAGVGARCVSPPPLPLGLVTDRALELSPPRSRVQWPRRDPEPLSARRRRVPGPVAGRPRAGVQAGAP
uniref:Fe-s oxidoreductase n=1 Tax=Tetraselmis sp. GSL018 TaxID=582737 RepID=A0A061S601_9CHLO